MLCLRLPNDPAHPPPTQPPSMNRGRYRRLDAADGWPKYPCLIDVTTLLPKDHIPPEVLRSNHGVCYRNKLASPLKRWKQVHPRSAVKGGK